MKTVRNILSATAVISFMAAVACSGQTVRITGLDARSGQLGFTLAPAATVSDYSCSVEWRSTLSAGGWTNAWYQPLTPFAQSNGMFHAALPRFFRILCTAGQTTNSAPINYTVTGVIPSYITNGVIYWSNNGNTNLSYYVEQATGTNGPWLSQWACRMNIHTTTTVTNIFNIPLFFRVVTITDSGELPW